MEGKPTLYSIAPPHAEVRFTEERSVDEVTASIAALHASDKAAEVEAGKQGKRATIFLVIMIVNLFIGFVLLPLLLLTPGWLVLFLVFRSKRIKAENQDVDDRKLHAVGRLLHVIGPELRKGKPVKVHLDFWGYEKLTPSSKNVSWGTGTFEWENQWLGLEFTLMDGSQMSLDAKSKVKRKQKSKRKWTKKKDRIVEELTVSLRPPKGKSVNPSGWETLKVMLDKHPTLDLKRVQPRGEGVSCQLVTRPAVRELTRYQGWVDHGLDALLDGHRTVIAVLSTYRAFIGSKQPEQ